MSTSRSKKGRAHEKRMAYLRSIGAGGYTDAAPVQKRVRFLHDELRITFDTIADRTTADVETVKMHYRGFRFPDRAPVVTCTKEVERKIMTARFSPSDGYCFPAVGIRRRLQALQAGGFPLKVISELTGKPIPQVHATLCGKTNKVFVLREAAELYVQAYEKLECSDPADWGVKPQAMGQTRTRAKANGYAPAHCWDPDTIDDPDAIPEWTGECGSMTGYRIHKRESIPPCGPCLEARRENDSTAQTTGLIRDFAPAKLRALREKKGLSRRQLSVQLGLDESTIYYWETGRSAPSRQNKIDLLLSALDATFEDVSESEDE